MLRKKPRPGQSEPTDVLNGSSEHRQPGCHGRFVDVSAMRDPHRTEKCTECRATRTRSWHDDDEPPEQEPRARAHVEHNEEAARSRDAMAWVIVGFVAIAAAGILAKLFAG